MNIQPISFSPPQTASAEASVTMLERKAANAANVEQQKAQPVSADQLKSAVASVREYIEPINSNLEFSINDDTHQVVIKVVDKATKELIRQIPSEEMLAIAKALDSIKGLFIKQQA